MIYKYEIELEIDEETIHLKYPNYKIKYSHPKEFAEATIRKIIHELDIDLSVDGLEKWGYSLKAKEIQIDSQ